MTRQRSKQAHTTPGPAQTPSADRMCARIYLVDESGEEVRLNREQVRTSIRQERSLEVRTRRARQAAILRAACEDRAANANLLREEREHERGIKEFWLSLRVPVRKARKRSYEKERRLRVESLGPRPRQLPSYSKAIVDARGRHGVYYQAKYVSGRKGASAIGCTKQAWLYLIRHGAYEHHNIVVPSIVSNMGADALEIGACCDLLESVQRAERANAKLFTKVIIRLPHDLTPEGRVVVMHDLCEQAFGAFDLPYAAVVHTPSEEGNQKNYHAHIMVWWRPTIHTAPYEWQMAKDLATEHDSREMTLVHRELFAEILTRVCKAEGREREYTGLSHAQRGLAIKPQAKLGPHLTAAYRAGEQVPAVERQAEVIRQNEALLQADLVGKAIEKIEQLRAGLRHTKPIEKRLAIAKASAVRLPARPVANRLPAVLVHQSEPRIDRGRNLDRGAVQQPLLQATLIGSPRRIDLMTTSLHRPSLPATSEPLSKRHFRELTGRPAEVSRHSTVRAQLPLVPMARIRGPFATYTLRNNASRAISANSPVIESTGAVQFGDTPNVLPLRTHSRLLDQPSSPSTIPLPRATAATIHPIRALGAVVRTAGATGSASHALLKAAPPDESQSARSLVPRAVPNPARQTRIGGVNLAKGVPLQLSVVLQSGGTKYRLNGTRKPLPQSGQPATAHTLRASSLSEATPGHNALAGELVCLARVRALPSWCRSGLRRSARVLPRAMCPSSS